MRWYPVADKGPKPGDLRKRSGFLFWPRRDKETGQWRWLEWSWRVEEYAYFSHNEDRTTYSWQVKEWLP